MVQRSNDIAQKDAQNKSSTEECAEDMEQKEHALPMAVQNSVNIQPLQDTQWHYVRSLLLRSSQGEGEVSGEVRPQTYSYTNADAETDTAEFLDLEVSPYATSTRMKVHNVPPYQPQLTCNQSQSSKREVERAGLELKSALYPEQN
eukprot:scaffold3939_cov173-Skeletonema_dohrnii-CCMP3373.AAC.3